MNDITPEELNNFRGLVSDWLKTESDINKKTSELRELKNLKKKIYEPQIIKFMVDNNIGDLNTKNGKIKCNERKVKKPLNKVNIRDNLSKIIQDEIKIDQAMTLILQNRETVVKYTLTQPKK
tara:strand:+ start:70 stop:435 length:366 start_codon:yes stop_codon:yes gene_type:complete